MQGKKSGGPFWVHFAALLMFVLLFSKSAGIVPGLFEGLFKELGPAGILLAGLFTFLVWVLFGLTIAGYTAVVLVNDLKNSKFRKGELTAVGIIIGISIGIVAYAPQIYSELGIAGLVGTVFSLGGMVTSFVHYVRMFGNIKRSVMGKATRQAKACQGDFSGGLFWA